MTVMEICLNVSLKGVSHDERYSCGTAALKCQRDYLFQVTGTPSALKYEADRGTGVTAIMHLLMGSDKTHEDRTVFMTAQVLFWMLGAIDGHAKNFSTFLRPGSRLHLTPLYDVISIYPLAGLGCKIFSNAEAGQINKNRSIQNKTSPNRVVI